MSCRYVQAVLEFKSLADGTIDITTIRVVYLWLVGMLVTRKKTNIICHGKLMPNDIASSLSGRTIFRLSNGLCDEVMSQ